MTRLVATLSIASLVSVVVATACGSSDNSVAARGEGGAAGDAGAPPVARGGTSTTPSNGGAPGAVGQGGGAEPQSEGGAGGAPAAETGGAGGAEGGAESSVGGAEGGVGAAGAEGGAGGASSEVVVDLDFEGSETLPANLNAGTATLTPSQGFATLGSDGNKFGETFLRGPTGTVITLTLTDLPPHTTLSIAMLFAAIDSLDGTGTFPAGDFFKITVDDVVVFRESFANAIETQIQSYAPPAAVILARRVDLGFAQGSYYFDSAYDFGLDPALQNLPHTASSATLVFTLEGEGVQDINDESWALDNLRVTVR